MLALSPAELHFCQQQKRTYVRIYNALKSSDIPFTSKQWEMLGSIRAHMKYTTGHPSSRADISMMNELTSLLDLLSREDHLSSKESGSMVINSTMEKQVELMIEELSDLVWEESRRVRPFRATHESPLDIATFVTIHLREIQQRKSNSRTKFMLYSGCKEILRQLTLVFSESNFPFNNHQHRQIENLCTSIRRFNGDPKTENFEGIKLQFLAFVCSLQQNPPPREIVKTNTATMTDPSGPVTKAVDYITFGLHGLARTTSEHLQNYKAESRDSPLELITIIINQFMRIYPPRYTFPQPRAHNINGNPMDASISI